MVNEISLISFLDKKRLTPEVIYNEMSHFDVLILWVTKVASKVFISCGLNYLHGYTLSLTSTKVYFYLKQSHSQVKEIESQENRVTKVFSKYCYRYLLNEIKGGRILSIPPEEILKAAHSTSLEARLNQLNGLMDTINYFVECEILEGVRQYHLNFARALINEVIHPPYGEEEQSLASRKKRVEQSLNKALKDCLMNSQKDNKKRVEFARFLIRHGASPEYNFMLGKSIFYKDSKPLFQIVQLSDDPDDLIELEQANIVWNQELSHGRNALYFALMAGHYHMADYLLKKSVSLKNVRGSAALKPLIDRLNREHDVEEKKEKIEKFMRHMIHVNTNIQKMSQRGEATLRLCR